MALFVKFKPTSMGTAHLLYVRAAKLYVIEVSLHLELNQHGNVQIAGISEVELEGGSTAVYDDAFFKYAQSAKNTNCDPVKDIHIALKP